MRQFTTVSGFAAVELTDADIPALLQRLTRNGISLFRVQQKDALTVIVWVRRRDLEKIRAVANKQGAEVTVIQRTGIYWVWRSLMRRPVILVGIALILMLSWWLPTRVLFIAVEGNSEIPTNLILEKAAECGITFGATRRDVRSEKMKNNLLAALPELQWTGINTYGCTAVISVTERSKTEEQSVKRGVSSIVADRDGIIHSVTVVSGNPVCTQGQVVRAGQILVSGYTDCGIKIQGTRAQAEVHAQTTRELTVISPLRYIQKGEISQIKKKYSLIIGKKRINFSKDSGISPSGCDKMYSQYYCVLPGGFQLPIALSVEKWYFRKTDSISALSETYRLYTEDFAQRYLTHQMLSGKILGKQESAVVRNDVYILSGRYICLEMIGRERSEEIITHDG